MHHTVIYEATPTGYSAYVRDLPGLRGRREDAERGRASHPLRYQVPRGDDVIDGRARGGPEYVV